jgi:polysaccharide biosynthesis protein PslH
MSERSLLLVKHRIPFPLEIGSDAVSFALLRVLQTAFALTLVSINDGERSAQGAQHLRSLGVDVILGERRGTSKDSTIAGSIARNAGLIFTGRPRLMQSQTAPSLRARLNELTRSNQFALVHLEDWVTAAYRPFVHAPAALLNHDAWFRTVESFARYERAPVQKLFWWLEARAVRRYETAIQDRFDWRLFLSEEDKRELIPDVKAPRSEVLPVPFPFEPADPASLEARRHEPRILFVGAMNVKFNIDAVCYFVERIWPDIRRVVPDATFVIAGRQPADRVQNLARQPGVRIEGKPDLDALLRESQVAVSSARIGTGIKVKVAQAMAAGLPVVGTVPGLSGFSGAACLLRADDAESFAGQVIHLLREDEFRRRISRECHGFYRDHLWMESVRPKVIELYQRIIEDIERPADVQSKAASAVPGGV